MGSTLVIKFIIRKIMSQFTGKMFFNCIYNQSQIFLTENYYSIPILTENYFSIPKFICIYTSRSTLPNPHIKVSTKPNPLIKWALLQFPIHNYLLVIGLLTTSVL